ncbi:SUKH-3 domain-containing protein [Paenibacillus thiaminolyticus]|uniref:SUKH-3 domain-containing protein n=1 Tax=Paenibacillus thiaminolyticus TaxID=49283 RepID=UPI00232BD009|nr:SUKH-3 domain-containing protein [Paenibacillus thiaminolyticus]WCF08291.1 SUKH-3 domain-containing protein [Paenibacillus thiaminolyticus]
MSKTPKCPQEKISKQEQLVLLLKKAGWHEDRHVDISSFELRCQAEGVELFDSAKHFLHQFSGLDSIVYFQYIYEPPDSRFADAWYDYTFDFLPDDLDEIAHSEEYQAIVDFAQEDCFCLGESGYYYPAVAAIGRSGKLYFKHDYEDVVRVFDSLLHSMEHELKHLDLVTSSLYEKA